MQLPPFRKSLLLSVMALTLLALSSSFSLLTSAFSNGENASIVIGQSDFSGFENHAGTNWGVALPTNVAFDSSGNLWVTDPSNSRVLEFTAPLHTGENASIVLGQPGFTTIQECTGSGKMTELCDPEGLAFDPSGNLWVSDASRNNWVLEFKAPFSSGEQASLLLGTAPFDGSMNATSLAQPRQIAFDSSGNLWVADTGNSRLLRFNAPITNHEAASLVLGASDFNSSIPASLDSYLQNKSAIPGPVAIRVDKSGNVWTTNAFNIVTMFAPPFSIGEAPSVIIGNASLGSSTTSTTAKILNNPEGIAFDSSGNLWVSDSQDNRVVEFSAPLTSGEAASTVLGHSDLTTVSPPLNNNSAIYATQSDLWTPAGIAFDSAGNLWVADNGFSRILEFAPSGAPAIGSSSSSTSTSSSTASLTGITTPTTSLVVSSTQGSSSQTTTSAAGLTPSSSAATSSSQSSSATSISISAISAVIVVFLVATGTSLLVLRRKS